MLQSLTDVRTKEDHLPSQNSSQTSDLADSQQVQIFQHLKKMAESMLPVELPSTEGNTVGNTALIEDVLMCILRKLEVPDLMLCRLVNKFWCRCATRVVKPRTKAVKITRESHQKNLMKFARTVEGKDPSRCLPYEKYHIDISQRIAQADPYFVTVFDHISQEKCKKLKLIFHFRPEVLVDAEKAAVARNGKMSFVSLENLDLKIRFYDGFTPQFMNMEELLQDSEGLRKINLSLTSYIINERQHPIVSSILRCFTNTQNNFRNVTTLGIDYSYLKSEHLKILTAWSHPIKTLALGTFDLKPDKRVGFPGEALTEFLTSQKDTLLNLRICVGKPYEWEDHAEDQGELIFQDDNVYIPPVCNPQRVTLPKMPKLRSFEVLASNPNKVGVMWAWRLDHLSLPETFPSLKKFSLIMFWYSFGDSTGFLPKLDQPSQTVEEVNLPASKDRPDPALFHRMIRLFPKISSLEICYERMTFENICLSLPGLVKLTLHLGEDLLHLDSILTGAPSLEHRATLCEKEAEKFNIESVRSRPSLINLINLEELVITTEDYYVRITDVTVHHVFLVMKKFSKLTIDAYPWEERTNWIISSKCMAKLKEKVKTTLNVHNKCYREKFFLP
ncbi:unnamed protein product [Allacma fusca]|uniref:F-box domain-containing protein n=1 Tax=Allacma fusca TaxID=39272 RepID=A0A8J2L2C3_9HEXA|nr:unnamed protein product [Allacma fusca]